MVSKRDNVQLILASASPRRREFIRQLGIPFRVQAADVDEQATDGEPPARLVARLSRDKAGSVARQFPTAVVVGADTVVVIDGEVLGKPADEHEAVEMLRRLRARPHTVYSGITVHPIPPSLPLTAVVASTVWMRPYTDAEIAAYVASGDPLDKAGAYGVQNSDFYPVARMRGCYAGVMGLPLCRLTSLLKRVGIVPPVDAPVACRAVTGVACCGVEGCEFIFNKGGSYGM